MTRGANVLGLFMTGGFWFNEFCPAVLCGQFFTGYRYNVVKDFEMLASVHSSNFENFSFRLPVVKLY